MVHKQCALHKYNGLLSVVHRVVMSAQLAQDSAHVKMRVCLGGRFWLLLFDLKGLLEEDQ